MCSNALRRQASWRLLPKELKTLFIMMKTGTNCKPKPIKVRDKAQTEKYFASIDYNYCQHWWDISAFPRPLIWRAGPPTQRGPPPPQEERLKIFYHSWLLVQATKAIAQVAKWSQGRQTMHLWAAIAPTSGINCHLNVLSCQPVIGSGVSLLSL